MAIKNSVSNDFDLHLWIVLTFLIVTYLVCICKYQIGQVADETGLSLRSVILT